MCGIAGMINRRNLVTANEKQDIDGMLLRIYHRGPDDTGACGIGEHSFENKDKAVHIEDNVQGILGFNRLSIQDLSQAGHQPMISDDGNAVITFNGEIYNVDELKEKLHKDGCCMSFRGHSDTEVILKCYSVYGMDKTLRMLNGMFAIVIADIRKKEIYIARDRIGIIPCHLMINENRIVWASEIKAFLALSEFRREVSKEAISDSLKFCYSNASIYKNVENTEPGTYYTYNWSSNTVSKCCYYSLTEHYRKKHRTDIHECEQILKDCLSRQLISDAPLGIQLSGGIDSTLLAKYASDIYQNNGAELCGFSLVNRTNEKYNEEKWIDYAAGKLQIDVHKYDFNDDIFASYFEKALYAYERFVNVPSPVGIYLFSTEARKHITVLISGEGADELAGGYGDFSAARLFGMYEKIAGRRIAQKYGRYYPQSINPDYIVNFDSMMNDEKCRQIYPSFDIEESIQRRKDYYSKLSGSSFDKMRFIYFKEELVSLLERQNKVCMANSVENRVPFLDNRFIDLLLSTDEGQLVHPILSRAFSSRQRSSIFEGKYLLKQISADIYGKEFAFRKKQNVRVPLSNYIQNIRFQDYLNGLIIPGMRKRGIVDMKAFDRAYSNMEESLCLTMVWKAINMETWLQLFCDGRSVVKM
ncbi:MAG: asparagine synthase (glutamine-hydrolyzing) [Clostridiales bacterium]|nr:asparagine synthase (glutamine-hydrolyzing) [Clostridiales bacterium]